MTDGVGLSAAVNDLGQSSHASEWEKIKMRKIADAQQATRTTMANHLSENQLEVLFSGGSLVVDDCPRDLLLGVRYTDRGIEHRRGGWMSLRLSEAPYPNPLASHRLQYLLILRDSEGLARVTEVGRNPHLEGSTGATGVESGQKANLRNPMAGEESAVGVDGGHGADLTEMEKEMTNLLPTKFWRRWVVRTGRPCEIWSTTMIWSSERCPIQGKDGWSARRGWMVQVRPMVQRWLQVLVLPVTAMETRESKVWGIKRRQQAKVGAGHMAAGAGRRGEGSVQMRGNPLLSVLRGGVMMVDQARSPPVQQGVVSVGRIQIGVAEGSVGARSRNEGPSDLNMEAPVVSSDELDRCWPASRDLDDSVEMSGSVTDGDTSPLDVGFRDRRVEVEAARSKGGFGASCDFLICVLGLQDVHGYIELCFHVLYLASCLMPWIA
ncbi:hypothetical protein Dimus_005706 [Dionaea muscipula]